MSETAEGPFSAELRDPSPLSKAMETFSKCQHELRRAIKLYGESDGKLALNEMQQCRSITVRAFRNCVTSILSDETDRQNAISLIAGLLKGDVDDLADVTNGLTQCSDTEPFELDTVIQQVEEQLCEAETEDDFVNELVSSYAQNVNEDIEHLLGHIPPATPELSPTATVGRHLLDVGKIALGVVIGIKLAQRAKF